MDLRFILNGSPDGGTPPPTPSTTRHSRRQPVATAPSPNRSTPRGVLATSPASPKPSPRIREHTPSNAIKTQIRSRDSPVPVISPSGRSSGPSGAAASNTQNTSKDVVIPDPIIKVNKNGKKTFQCPICFSGFTAKGHCTVHVRTVHLGLIDAICPLCHAEFPQRGSCMRHYNNVHCRLKRYFCPDESCGRPFAENWSAKCHFETVHLKIKRHPCRVEGCSKIFSEKWNRKKHEKAVHKQTLDPPAKPTRRRSVQESTASPTMPPAYVPGSTNVLHSSRSRREIVPPLENLTPDKNLTRSGSVENTSPRVPVFDLGEHPKRSSTVASANTPAGVAELLLMSQGNWNPKSNLKNPARGEKAVQEYMGGSGNSSRRDASRRSKSAGPLRSKSRKLTEKKSVTKADGTDSELSGSSRHSRLRKGQKKRD